jgi:hypothetical protein
MELISSCVNIPGSSPQVNASLNIYIYKKNTHPYFKPARTKNIINLKERRILVVVGRMWEKCMQILR